MSKAILAAAFAAVISIGIIGRSAPVLAQEAQVKAAPVDFRACNFQDGKGMKDLEKVTEKFRAYANKHDFDYTAWTLKPQFHRAVPYDIAWLGSWPSNEAFGVSMEKWAMTGKALAAEFDSVMDCNGWHELAMWIPITAFDATPEEGVLMISRCVLNEGKSNADAYRAHISFGNHMRGLGSMAQSWLFYPTLGTGDVDFDYYHAIAFYRYSDMGAAMDLYANGGGYGQAQKVLWPVSQCETPVVFDVMSVRAIDER